MKQEMSNQYLHVVARALARIPIPFLAVLIALVLMQRASAEDFHIQASFAQPQREAISINVTTGQSRVIRFDQPISKLSVSNPEVGEAVVISANQVVINGKALGQSNIIVWDTSGERSLVFDIYVRANLELVDALIKTLFPKDDILLSQSNGSIILSGTVNDPKKIALAESVVQTAGFKTVNMLRGSFKQALQVQLQVRVAEVNRNRMKEFGTSYLYQGSPGAGGYVNSGGGPSSVSKIEDGSIFGSVSSALNVFLMSGNVMSLIRVLHSQGALRALAEPNLIAMDGQQASFLAGGEFPVPIVQSGTDRSTVTIVFKEYGVRLGFKPTVVGEDYIRLDLEPEVSTIDYVNGVRFDGFVVPALRTRRAKTTIELRDGQSFALAGLLDNSETKSLSKIPVLGDIPILGALFRSKTFQKQESELMFIVTAQIVRPINPDSLPQMRGLDDLKKGSPLDNTDKGGELTGKTGFSANNEPPPNTPVRQVPVIPSWTLQLPPVTPARTPARRVTTVPDLSAISFAVKFPSEVVNSARARRQLVSKSAQAPLR